MREQEAPSPGFVIASDRQGFAVAHASGRKTTCQIEWSSVRRAVAFKRDLLAVDMVCLTLECADGPVEVNEEMGGWQEFVEALPKYLPGTRPWRDWFFGIVLPAFATNETVVFERVSDQ